MKYSLYHKAVILDSLYPPPSPPPPSSLIS